MRLGDPGWTTGRGETHPLSNAVFIAAVAWNVISVDANRARRATSADHHLPISRIRIVGGEEGEGEKKLCKERARNGA